MIYLTLVTVYKGYFKYFFSENYYQSTTVDMNYQMQ